MATVSYLDADRFKLLPLSLPLLCTCPCRSVSSQSLILHRRCSKLIHIPLVFTRRKPIFRFSQNGLLPHRRVITAVAQAEPDRLDEGNAEEVLGHTQGVIFESQQKVSQLKNRIIFGIGIGIAAGGVVLAGGWVFTVAFAAAVFAGAREYFELVRSRGITEGMTPPPRYVSQACSIICTLMPMFIM